jgi:hypothetical protein
VLPDHEWPAGILDAAVDEISDHLARAVEQFGWSSLNTKRQHLRKRLELLRESLKTAVDILGSAGHLRDKTDVDLLGLSRLKRIRV